MRANDVLPVVVDDVPDDAPLPDVTSRNDVTSGNGASSGTSSTTTGSTSFARISGHRSAAVRTGR